MEAARSTGVLVRRLSYLAVCGLALVACSTNDGAGESSGDGGDSLARNPDGYPSRPIVLRLPAPGSQTEALGRAVAVGMSTRSPVQVRVDPLPNGGTDDAASSVVRDARTENGEVVGLITNSSVVSTALGSAPFTFEDMEGVATIATQPLALAVRADSPYKTFGDFVAAARSDATRIRVGLSGTAGGLIHIAAIQIGEAVDARGDLAIIPHKTAGESVLTLLGGGVDAAVGIASGFQEQAKANQVRVLASTGGERTEALADIQTIKEAGYDLVIVNQMNVITGSKVPDDKVRWLSSLFEATSQLAEVKAEMVKLGWTPTYVNAPDTQAGMRSTFDDARTLGQELGLI